MAVLMFVEGADRQGASVVSYCFWKVVDMPVWQSCCLWEHSDPLLSFLKIPTRR